MGMSGRHSIALVWTLLAFSGTAAEASALWIALEPDTTPAAEPRKEGSAPDLDAPPTGTLLLPPKDAGLQAALEELLRRPPYQRLVGRGQLSVAVADLSRPGVIRYAGVDDDHMRYAASLPKIAIMLGVFDQIEKGGLEYDLDVRTKLERMIRRSDNRTSSQLIELVGFEAIAAALTDPRHELYDPDRQGGLWVGKDYGGSVGRWKRDPMHQISHGATARQVARFYVMLDRGELVSPWASQEMARILSKPEIKHKFIRGLSTFDLTRVLRKSGTWREWHADSALVEREGRRYVAVALMQSSTRGVFTRLIVDLDRIVGSSLSTQGRP